MLRAAAILTACALALLTAGCATIVKGTTQAVSITTPGVPGAQCTLTSSAIGSKVVTTPATITLDKGSDNIAVICRRTCYQDATGIIASNTETVTAGNIVAGGVIGLGVDAATGAMNKYNTHNQITMVPIPGCRG